VQHQSACRASLVGLRDLTGGGVPVPGGPPQRRARRRARQRRRLEADRQVANTPAELIIGAALASASIPYGATFPSWTSSCIALRAPLS